MDHHDMGELYEDGSVELPARDAISSPRRIVTLLVYLNTLGACGNGDGDGDGDGTNGVNDFGGSTRFPLLTSNDKSDGDGGENNKGLDIYPKRGMAVLWCNIKKDGMPDERLVHSGQMIRNVPVSTASHPGNTWNGVSDAGVGITTSNISSKVGVTKDDAEIVSSGGIQCLPSIASSITSSSPVVKYAMNIWACEEQRH